MGVRDGSNTAGGVYSDKICITADEYDVYFPRLPKRVRDFLNYECNVNIECEAIVRSLSMLRETEYEVLRNLKDMSRLDHIESHGGQRPEDTVPNLVRARGRAIVR